MFNAKITITPNFSNGKNNPQTGYCGITEIIDEKVKVPIKFTTKIIKFVAITRAGFTSASSFPVLIVASYFAGIGTIYLIFKFNSNVGRNIFTTIIFKFI